MREYVKQCLTESFWLVEKSRLDLQNMAQERRAEPLLRLGRDRFACYSKEV
jgi:hypothetical protein